MAFDKTRASERQAAVASVDAAGSVLLAAIKANISLTDHSSSDLAKLDHPYARRHGAIRIHNQGTKMLRSPSNQVHTQSGQLLRALKGGASSGGLSYRVELDTGIAPHANYIVKGTRVMLPRDVLWDTAEAPEVKRRMMTAIVKVLGKMLRSKSSIRFGSISGTGTVV